MQTGAAKKRAFVGSLLFKFITSLSYFYLICHGHEASWKDTELMITFLAR
jgi:hypothetical protein